MNKAVLHLLVAIPVNETNVQVSTHNYHVKTVIGGGEKTLYNFDKILDHLKRMRKPRTG